MSAHTPGPWKIFPTARERFSQLITNADCLVEVAYTREVHSDRMTYGPTVETLANARLIAAAPELLEALIAMVECDKEAIADAERFGIPFPDELLTSYHQACAAITKATGKTP